MNGNSFFLTALQFAELLAASLTTGAMFGVTLSHNPAGLAPAIYIAQQQNAIRALNVKLPLLGALTIVLTATVAALAPGDLVQRAMLWLTAGCFLGAGGITRFLNQPINAIVMTWSPDSPPQDWMRLRDCWWQWHLLRTTSAITGLVLLLIATLTKTVLL